MVDEEVVKALGLPVRPGAKVSVARLGDPTATTECHEADLAFPDSTLPSYAALSVVPYDIHTLCPDYDAIIGRDLLRAYVLIYNGTCGLFTLST